MTSVTYRLLCLVGIPWVEPSPWNMRYVIPELWRGWCWSRREHASTFAPELLHGLRNDFVNAMHLLARSHSEQVSTDRLELYAKRLYALPPAILYDDFLACNSFDRMADLDA